MFGRFGYGMFEGLVFVFLLCGAGVAWSQTYEGYIVKSYEFLEWGELLAAEECLCGAMRLEPGNPNNYALLTNLGTVQRRQGKLEEAVVSYTAALGRRPDDVVVLDNRASLYAEMGETEKAIADYSLLLANSPLDKEAFYSRGILYLRMGDFMRAEADFERLLELDAESVRGRLGHALLEKARGNYDMSERIYNYLIDRLPRDWTLYEGRADLYFRMGKNARAMADISRVFAETEPDAGMYVLRGKVKLALYEREPARKDFLKAGELGYDAEIIEGLLLMTR